MANLLCPSMTIGLPWFRRCKPGLIEDERAACARRCPPATTVLRWSHVSTNREFGMRGFVANLLVAGLFVTGFLMATSPYARADDAADRKAIVGVWKLVSVVYEDA